jgi:plasmid stabilization system protein ParE
VRVVITEAAEADLAALYAHNAVRSGPAAGQVLGTILRAIIALAAFPRMGRPGAVPETRSRVVTRYPYHIVYHVDEAKQIGEIWRVLHGAQQ